MRDPTSTHGLDTEFQQSSGYTNFHRVACFFVEQCLGDRRLDGDLAFAQVCLVRTGYRVGHTAVVAQVGHLHLAEQLHATRSLSCLRVDHTGILQHTLFESDAP